MKKKATRVETGIYFFADKVLNPFTIIIKNGRSTITRSCVSLEEARRMRDEKVKYGVLDNEVGGRKRREA